MRYITVIDTAALQQRNPSFAETFTEAQQCFVKDKIAVETEIEGVKILMAIVFSLKH